MIKIIVCKRTKCLIKGDDCPAKVLQILSNEEKEKAYSYHNNDDVENYIIGRYLLRTELEKITGVKAKNIFFDYDANGRPHLRDKIISKLDFNISHSNKFVTLAMNTDGRIGIDIEKNDPLDLNMMSDVLNAKDLDFIGNMSNNKDYLRKFYKLWTLKESFVKALGCGLQYPVKRLFFVFDEKGTIHIKGNADSGKWFFKTHDVNKQYHLAVCVQDGSIKNDINFIQKYI
jgi:4'-phosphopantetheinyl transferase